MRVVVECSPCRARIVVIRSLVGYFTSRSFSRYLSVPSGEDCELQGPSSVADWLAGHCFGPRCGLAASRHSAFACRWHAIVHATADTWNKISASSVLLGARTLTELMGPNGPMVAVGHVRHNHKSIQCLNYSGGASDNHRYREREARCRDLTSLNEHHLC